MGWLVGWPFVLFLIAEQLRNLGKFAYADVVSFRLQQGPVRTMAAIGSLIVVIWYLIGQAVGAGQLLHTLVPQISSASIVIIGALIIIYVTSADEGCDVGADHQGGPAARWRDIDGAGVMAHEGWSFNKLFSDAVAAHPKHLEIMQSVGAHRGEGRSDRIDLARPDADVRDRRPATHPDALLHRRGRQGGTQVGALRHVFIGYFYILTFIIGFGAIGALAGNAEYVVNVTKNVLNLKGGSSMPAVYLSHTDCRGFLPRLHRRGRLRHDPGGGVGLTLARLRHSVAPTSMRM